MSSGIIVLRIHIFKTFGFLYKKSIPFEFFKLSTFIKPFCFSLMVSATLTTKSVKLLELIYAYLEKQSFENRKKNIKNKALKTKFFTFFNST